MSIYDEIEAERLRAEAKHGDQGYRGDVSTRPNDRPLWIDVIRGPGLVRNWVDNLHRRDDKRLGYDLILLEEVSEACEAAGNGDPEALREELIQVAAMVVSWVRTIDGRAA